MGKHERCIAEGFPPPRHDHDACIDAAMDEAERLCRERGVKLTTLRRRVLELIWQSHRPVTAYALLELLVREGRRAQAPTVYRSLQFLLDAGLIHRIESLNAYVGCTRPRQRHDVGIFICESCGEVAEVSDPGIGRSIMRAASRVGFDARSGVIEVSGTCRTCSERVG